MEFFPSFGGAPYKKNSVKVIRLLLKGCVNRPFFHISVQEKHKETDDPVIEQLGSFDPMPNKNNEKLVVINFQRLKHWLKEGVTLTEPVEELLGLCGYFPIHPNSFKDAYENRNLISKELERLKIEAAKFSVALDSNSDTESSTSNTQESTPSTEESTPPIDESTPPIDESTPNKES